METIKLNDVEYVKKEDYDKIVENNGRDSKIIDPANVIMMVNVTEDADNFYANNWTFPDKKTEAYLEIVEKEVISVYQEGVRMVRISYDYFKKAERIIKLWQDGKLRVSVKEKNFPVLLHNGQGLGFILAPRIEEEDLQ